jgi:hypothetical protein
MSNISNISNEYIILLKENLDLCKIDHEYNILQEKTLKHAHIYCIIHKISSQQFGSLLENYIKVKFNYVKNKAKNCSGDCTKMVKILK